MPPNCVVEYYRSANGDIPVLAFLQGLPTKDAAKMLTTLKLLETLGTFIRMPHAKAIVGEKNLFELRSQVGNNIQRVFYCQREGQRFLLLHGFTKKTQKTPPQEIDTAKRYRDNAQKETPS